MATPIVTLDMVPEQALELLNSHDHDNTTTPVLGDPVTNGSIANNAITESKIADASVTLAKLNNDVKDLITAVSNGGVPGLTNFIAEGLDFTPNTGLNLTVNKGRASISEQTVTLTADQLFSLDARMAALLYLQKNGTIGKKNAALPAPDNNTVVQYRFNQTVAGAVIPNYAVGLSSIAIPNDLTPSGGLSSVDGWTDYAIKADGTSGYYVSANNTGFPAGASEREIDIEFTVNSITGIQNLWIYGTSSPNLFQLYTNGSRLILSNGATNYDTGYDVEIGKIYLVSMIYDGANLKIYITSISGGGGLVYALPVTLTTPAGNLYLLRANTAIQYSSATIHWIEIRNKCRTPQQIAQMSNALLFPYTYQKTSAQYPTIATADLATAYHEYKFDETSSTSVADSNTSSALTGTATGTTIIDSEMGLNKARKFNGTSDYITFGNYAFTGDFTIIACLDFDSSSTGVEAIISNRNSALTLGNIFCISANNNIQISNTSALAVSTGTIARGKPVFCAVSSKSLLTHTFYCDSPNIDSVTTLALNTGTSPLVMGKDGGRDLYYFKGIHEYLIILPRALSQPEIALYYNALMKTGQLDIREILPTDSISLGRALTTSSAVKEISLDYQFGRREKAYNGNRKKFLGWKYFSGQQPLTWNNPFGSRKIKTYFTYAQNALGDNETDIGQYFFSGANDYGVVVRGTSSARLSILVGTYGAAYLNGGWQTSGYIGCYAEVLD